MNFIRRDYFFIRQTPNISRKNLISLSFLTEFCILLYMIKTVLPLSLIVILFTLLFSSNAYAESSVKVNINNSDGSSSDENTSIDCNTKVKITVNGETKTYDSSDCNKEINVQSNNGESKVEVKSGEGEAKVDVNSNMSSVVKEESDTPTKEVKKEIKEIVDQHKDRVKKVVEEQQKHFFATLLDSLFSFITLQKKD
jgi:hypothetical protein